MDSMTLEQRTKVLEDLSLQRWKDAESGDYEYDPRILPEKLTKDADPITTTFYNYYRTERGYHINALNSNGSWRKTSAFSFMNFPILNFVKEVSPRPALIIAGDRAHSRYMSEDVYKDAAEPKELLIIKDADHCDLYDNMDRIPFDKIKQFFTANLK